MVDSVFGSDLGYDFFSGLDDTNNDSGTFDWGFDFDTDFNFDFDIGDYGDTWGGGAGETFADIFNPSTGEDWTQIWSDQQAWDKEVASWEEWDPWAGQTAPTTGGGINLGGLLDTASQWLTENKGLAGGLGTLGAGYLAGENIDKAVAAMETGYGEAIGTTREARTGARTGFDPYTTSGLEGLQGYRDLLADPTSIRDLPGYQFMQEEQAKGIMRASSAAGERYSGGMFSELMERGGSLADLTYGKRLAEFQGQAQMGQQAQTGLSALEAGYAGDIASAQIGRGAAQMSGYSARNQLLNKTLSDLGSIFGYTTQG